LLLGAGIAGGQVIGGYDEGLTGMPIDLDTGEPGDTYLSAAHLGATLLELAGVEGTVEPIRAALG
jgi:hypothetical protein